MYIVIKILSYTYMEVNDITIEEIAYFTRNLE